MQQDFKDKVFGNIPSRVRNKIIIDVAMNLLIYLKHFQDLTNLFKTLIKFRLKMWFLKCKSLRNQLIYTSFTVIMKDGTAKYSAMGEKCDAIIKLKHPNLWKIAVHSLKWLTFCYQVWGSLKAYHKIYETLKTFGYIKQQNDASMTATGLVLFQFRWAKPVPIGYH